MTCHYFNFVTHSSLRCTTTSRPRRNARQTVTRASANCPTITLRLAIGRQQAGHALPSSQCQVGTMRRRYHLRTRAPDASPGANEIWPAWHALRILPVGATTRERRSPHLAGCARSVPRANIVCRNALTRQIDLIQQRR